MLRSQKPSPQRFIVPKQGTASHKFKAPEGRHGGTSTDGTNAPGIPRVPPRFTNSQSVTAPVTSPNVSRPRFNQASSNKQLGGIKTHNGIEEHHHKRARLLDDTGNADSDSVNRATRTSNGRFVFSPGKQDSPSHPNSKPHFLKSSLPQGATVIHDPLPDVFSPHRRRQQRFVTGGMAAELQSWIAEVGSDTLQAREHQLMTGDPVRTAVIHVNAVEGDDVLFVSGTGEHGKAIHVALVVGSDPSGAAAQAQRLNLMPGTRIAIRDPMWRLALPSEEDPLLFGVDWHMV